MEKTKIIQNYRDFGAVSQSELKQVLANSKKEFKPSVAMLLGSLVDTLITAPDTLDELYHITSVEKYPVKQIKEVWDKYYQICTDENRPLELDNLALLETYKSITSLRSSDDVLLANLMKHESYWEDLVESTGKVVVSNEYWLQCQRVVQSLLTNELTSPYFIEDLHTEIKFQMPLFWTYVDELGWQEECKGLLDMLIINHKDKTLQIADLKTSGEHLNSWKNNIARKHRLEFQMSYYSYGLTKWHETNYEDYEILNPILIVENVDWPGRPRIFDLTNRDLYIGQYGLDRVKSTLIYARDDMGYPTDLGFEEQRICGWQEALGIYHQAKELGLPDWDVHFQFTGGRGALNLWL